MSHAFPIFQRRVAAQNLHRAHAHYAAHRFLLEWSAKAMVDRLRYIKRAFHKILILSPREASEFTSLFPTAVVDVLDLSAPVCDPEDLPTTDGYDLILSVWDLHKTNDLPGVLICLRRALKPDGVFMACLPGGETLHELRASLLQAEISTLGGASPRVFPFIDKQQAAGLLQRAGFALPVVDSDVLSVSYRDIFHLMADIRGMGENNCLAGRYQLFTPSRLFFEAGKYYAATYGEAEGRIHASFEMVFLIGWAPHASQQQPAKRGSGQVSLTDVL